MEECVKKYENLREEKRNLYYLFSSNLENYKMVLNELGKIYMDLELYQNALSIYESLENLTKQFKCLIKIGRKSQAIEIVNLYIDTNPSPYLYCLLGDVTKKKNIL